MLERLINIDRRIIFILVAIAVVIPTFIKVTIPHYSLKSDTQHLRLH